MDEQRVFCACRKYSVRVCGALGVRLVAKFFPLQFLVRRLACKTVRAK